MLKKAFLSMPAGVMICPALVAQETDYNEAFFDYKLAEQIKNGTVDKKVSVEKIAEMYSTCQ